MHILLYVWLSHPPHSFPSQAQRTVKPPAAAPWEVPRRASSSSSSNNDVTVKNTSSNTNSSGSSGSAPGGRKSLLSGLPGKKGPLFSRKPAAGRGAAGAPGVEGLEPLQDLISPDLARARLQVSMCVYNSAILCCLV